MSGQDKELFEFGGFRLDPAERLLLCDGEPVALEPKVFETLLVLIRRSGRLVEKDELMQAIWPDSFVEEVNLARNISVLRKALNRNDGGPAFIETVPKRGYRFVGAVRMPAGEPDEVVVQTAKVSFIVEEENDDTTRRARDHAAQRAGKGTPESEPGATIEWKQSAFGSLKRHKLVVLLTLAALAAGVAAALYWFMRGKVTNQQVSNAPVDSIAVLPLENAAQDPNAEYLSDGITESLINRLSRLSSLKVMSSSSVFRYKGKRQDTQTVGSQLNVRAVLTGSVKQIGDQLVINVSLDDAKDNHHIWGEQYVRKFADILAVQNEIAQEVSTTLRVKLTGADERQLARRYTDHVEAYQLYLKGNYEWNKHTREDLQRGITYYNQALEIDPNYALAYFGLAASYGVLGNNYLPPHEAYPTARAYAAKALAIDDALAEAHVAMGAIKLFYDWDLAGAEREFKDAQILDPNNAETHHLYGDCLEILGRFDEAQTERKRALELDPLSPAQNVVAGATFYFAGQYDEAIAQLEKTISLVPHYSPYVWLGQAYEQKKMYEQAITTYQKGMTQGERHWQLIASLGHAYARSGKRDKALKVLDELREMSGQGYISPYSFAVVYAGLGDKEQTFAWLEKAYQDRSSFLIWLKVEPLFDSLRSEPRFQDLLRRVGLPVITTTPR
jgi:TolB-like protein/DNA-binding winged helix-turn-helix (wHTH) protein/Flp pilus assembly protein TadD